MNQVSRYWTWIRIDEKQGCKSLEILIAKSFFLAQFSQISDQKVQSQLFTWFQEAEPQRNNQPTEAEVCLRCFISGLIKQVCIRLEVDFGRNHGFTHRDLFPFVLDDVEINFSLKKLKDSYIPQAAKILSTFDPSRSNLATWTNRITKQERSLNLFLLEQGVYLLSDWAILNDTNPKQLERIYENFHQLSSQEIKQAQALLVSYHQVYRRDRWEKRKRGERGKCTLPTPEQLQEITKLFYLQTKVLLSQEFILKELQKLADLLREYRIHVRRGSLPTKPLDDNNSNLVARLAQEDNLPKEEEEFLVFYQEQLVKCLDQAIAEVIGDRKQKLRKKDVATAKKYLQALSLFHCQNKTMGEIAPLIGLRAQYQVTRLLKLKQLRVDIQQLTMQFLLKKVIKQSKSYLKPQQLQKLQQQIEEALEEQVQALIAEAESEVSKQSNLPKNSLFIQRMRKYLC